MPSNEQLELVRLSSAEDAGAPTPGPAVILVHGALDQHRSFRRTARSLARPTFAYDRRGYGSSVDAAPAGDILRHVDDLVRLAQQVTEGVGPPVVVGHSLGGLIALTATAAFPSAFAAVGAYEPPYRWKPWWPVDEDPVCAETPEATVEMFYRAVMGDAAWDGASDALRASLAAQGAALEHDLRFGLDGPVFDAGDILVPVRLSHGSASPAKYQRSAAEMAADLAECEIAVIHGASHGAHLSHPDGFGAFVEAVVAAASPDA